MWHTFDPLTSAHQTLCTSDLSTHDPDVHMRVGSGH